MNKIIVIFLSALTTISVFAQTTVPVKKKGKETPALVKSSFEKDYPEVKTVKWGAENEVYEAEFKINNVDYSANYDKSGKRVEVEMDIPTSQLPAAALEYISKNFPGVKISEAAKITDGKNTCTFEAEIKEKGKSSDLIFDSEGKFLLKKKAD